MHGFGAAALILNIRTIIENQELKLNNLSMTTVLGKYADAWLIEQMHISFPSSDEHGENEAYPNKELERTKYCLTAFSITAYIHIFLRGSSGNGVSEFLLSVGIELLYSYIYTRFCKEAG